MTLIDSLIFQGWLKTPEIIEAFKRIKRIDFLPDDLKALAELNEALPIGYKQTISQPLTVAFMMELLEAKTGQKILDVGSGSGWTTALLSCLVANDAAKGKVVAVEIVPELAELSRNNVAKYSFVEKGIAKVICADGARGYEQEAPYDRILTSASVQKEIPQAWKKQLKPGGRLVCPVNNSIWLIVKKGENEFEQKEFPGFIFVPLV